ncbi:MAG: YdiU family protein [Kocuria sp.]|nr:YdiU family protein [Kocuria sp.]
MIPLEHTYAQAVPQLSVRCRAQRAPEASVLVLNDSLAYDLGISTDFLRSPDGVKLLSGQVPDTPDGAPATYAQAYAGHQFGQFVPQLGDGRALLVGEILDVHGTRRDLHTKGSGQTPFSRGGDGQAPLSAMLREYLVGEAMHALGIPTTRALAVVSTGTHVQRRNPTPEPAATLSRIAASHLRVGTFQFAAVHRTSDVTKALADYAIERHWPHAAQAQNPYLELLRCLTHAQAQLVAQWMLVGFVHGVMNTDNMTICAETMDYGPCAFVDTFTRSAVFSSIDRGGRYAYDRQSSMALWNLSRWAETLLDLIDSTPDTAVDAATQVLHEYEPTYNAALARGFAAKIGVAPAAVDTPEASREFRSFVEDTFDLLETHNQDFTLFFRALAEGNVKSMMDSAAISPWMAARERLIQRWSPTQAADVPLMQCTNPVYIPRNHHLDHALQQAESGDLSDFHRLLSAVRDPFTPRQEFFGLESPGSTARFVSFCGT